MIKLLNIGLDTSADSSFGINRSSLLHGFIMEKLDPMFADAMHSQSIRPYSQNLIRDRNGGWIWQIKTLTDEAWDNFGRALSDTEIIHIRHSGSDIKIISRELYETSFEELFENSYFGDNTSKYTEIEFVTPTAFKSSGRYLNYPDIRMLLSGLIRKYDFCSDKTSVYTDDLLDELCARITVSGYELKSTCFHLEGVKIPSFKGRITLRTDGHTNLAHMTNMLASFGQYSGVGIKNALGMGAIRIIPQRRVYRNG
ncbi:MAG: CRISPR system precrRNA processing endoribonuclease RAMP protein Cas6 [Oscillospiraceae bacterium]|nr:CRISPR system precrRNA processing endoribonuclease RAMP protein Cas6 [Oscillospiraceae bacterium]